MLTETLKLRLFGLLKVPMIAYVRPRMVSVDSEHVVIAIPLGHRTKNHLNSMYFGALAVGADLAAGALCLRRIEETGAKVSFVFKDSQASFLRRPTGDVHFRCDTGAGVTALVDKALASGEREELAIPVVATVPSESEDPVATFTLTLSIKAR